MAHDTRTYGGLSNAYNRAPRELDRMKPRKARTPRLEEVIAQHRAQRNVYAIGQTIFEAIGIVWKPLFSIRTEGS